MRPTEANDKTISARVVADTRGKRHRWRGRVWRYGPLLLWLAFIFFASTDTMSADNTSRIIGPLLRWLFPLITPAQLATAHFTVRKLAHLTEYAILALLAAHAFLLSSRAWLRYHWFAASFAVAAFYALLDEYHQAFVSTRTGTITDSFIDMSGALFALALVSWWRSSPRRR